MVPPMTVKAYNDELARLIGAMARMEKLHAEEMDAARGREEGKDALIAGLRATVAELRAEVGRLRGSEAYHDGPEPGANGI